MSRYLVITNRDYRLLLSASSVSNLGDGIAMVALPWLATMLTSDPLLIAAVATAQRLPWLLFALPAGV
ncbi:MFS transporter [Roseinatronobacter monicus]|uniref:MFS transporter n=1 Tax=Roseinatronobacter monicus TaxID=393481 RepID=UPI001FE6BF2D|nr:MFS transporter [Roseinatronobacter monicus]